MKEWVEIFRCKDCVHNYAKVDPKFEFCGMFHHKIKPTDYCSWGREDEERKDG